MSSEKIKANFHGHLLAGFDPWWRKQFGIEGKNLAQVVTDKCIKKDLGIYTITNDFPEEFQKRSRFQQFLDEAKHLKLPYRHGYLGENSWIIEKGNRQVVYLDGQSIDDRILTFGTSSLPKNISLKDAANYLKDKGYLRIAEHPFAEGHHGALTEDQLFEMQDRNLIDAIEHNGKLAVPSPLSSFPKLKNYSRNCNERAEHFCKKYHTPLIANDDSDGISHIGTAYTIFDKSSMSFRNEEELIKSLNSLIKGRDFEVHKGHLRLLSFLRYALWILTVKEKMLGLKEKYNSKRHLDEARH